MSWLLLAAKLALELLGFADTAAKLAAKLETRNHDEKTGAIAEQGREADQALDHAEERTDVDQAVDGVGVGDLRRRVLADKRDDSAGQ